MGFTSETAMAVALVAVLLLGGCALNETAARDALDDGGTPRASGTINGTGASSMAVAQEHWIAGFQTANPDANVLYSPDGSGAGRDAFMGGGAGFAGSDRPLTSRENVAGTFRSCTPDSVALDLPVYVSPIAVIFHLDGVENLDLTADVLAAIFWGDVTNWSDASIAALNPDVVLPDLPITAVHRSDTSGTTESFTAYLHSAAGGVWDAEPGGTWPHDRGEAAKGTSGVVGAVTDGVGTIGYADASQTRGTATARIGAVGNFESPSAEAAAAAVGAAPVQAGRVEHDLALELDAEAGGYPIVLVSYVLACADYEDDDTAALARAYLGYVASVEGQDLAASGAGAAPLPHDLREQVLAAIGSIR